MEEKLVKQEYGSLTKSCRMFSALNFFLISAIFILVFSNLAGVNLPRYYPILHQWSVLPLEGPSMGFFGTVGFVLSLAIPMTVIFYFLEPVLQVYMEIRFKTFKSLSTAFIIFGILFYVAKEWKKWGIDKMGLGVGGFLNSEFTFFLLLLGMFLTLLFLLLILEKKIFE
ncbi:hypothetical protein LCGC14_3025270 [marine sediment metagenome]|uniref:Uncharacterized protein n=1 Tax=marine sediment metagenome TaxID=412755 RepID=A0A0F8WUJ1_9ZZZZ